jgi:tRNA nucleotidyltransferase (CCA-adding enzyme)
LSGILAKPVEKLGKKLKIKIETIHGSRDYFNLSYKAVFLEIIPILKIKKSSEARNITDISPLHVFYVASRLAKSRKLADEIRLAKTFCYVQGCYGAESYIKGFSGYSLEVLCIYFGSFLNFLKAAAQWKGKKIVIDSARHYKNKNDILALLNESKLQSPIVLIDPVQKERNVTAAVSSETFENFLKSAREFLKKPTDEFFKIKIDVSEDLRKKAKAKKAQFNAFAIESSSGKLDIAGAKSLRLSKFILNLMKKYGFDVLDSKFAFDVVMKKGFFYVACKNPSAKTEISGPPVGLEKYAANFRKKYKKTSVKNGKVVAIVKTKVRNAKDLLNELAGYKRELKEMQIKRVYLF